MSPKQRRVPARYHGGARASTTHIVWHATAGSSADSSLGWLNRPLGPKDPGKASYHALIERDGEIIWHTPHAMTAYHAGVSAWPYPDGKPMNGRSLGFAFCNTQLPPLHAKFERITKAQIESAAWLVQHFAPLYPGVERRSAQLRHRDCSPDRRNDPTPQTLDWEPFLNRICPELPSVV